MRRFLPTSILAGVLAAFPAGAGEAPVAPNGIALVRGWEDWNVVASYRPDKDHVRYILGNDAAMQVTSLPPLPR